MDNIKITNENGVEVIWIKTKSFEKSGDKKAFYTGFNPHKEILPKGWKKREDRAPLPCDINFEQDCGIVLRDGVKIYADIFLPVTEGKYPTIVSWSPYGKNGSGFEAGMDIEGVDMKSLSGLQKFEACDPGRWVNDGYALVNVDSRGSYMSEGDVHFWGSSEGKDAYDVVEWIASQEWSNGKVAFCGNSWLAVHQWFVAAEQPPHLTCIAPWEGHTDLLGDDLFRGGIPNPTFNSMVLSGTPGNAYIEHAPAMMVKYPYRNAFWDDKRPKFEQITVPAYIVASYNSPAHTRGSFEGFRKIASKDKWLRVHNTGEWPDFYAYQDDLKKFFDFYMKGIDNGWPNTPRVRISIIDPGGEDIIEQVEEDFPLKRQVFKKLYLTSDYKLSDKPQDKEVEYSYDANNKDAEISFTYKFEEDTDFIGYSKLHINIGVEKSNDMDLNVFIDKLSKEGNPLIQGGIGRYKGPNGKLRASKRKLDAKQSTESEPILALGEENLYLKEGEIVEVDVPIWPTGLRFHKGESLRITIKPDVPPMLPPPTEGSFDAAPGEAPKAGTAEEAFAMGAGAPGMPPMPPMGGGVPGMPPMPPMGGGAPGMPPMPPMGDSQDMFTAGEFGKDFSSMAPAAIIPTPPRPGGIHKFFGGGKYETYFYFPMVK